MFQNSKEGVKPGRGNGQIASPDRRGLKWLCRDPWTHRGLGVVEGFLSPPPEKVAGCEGARQTGAVIPIHGQVMEDSNDREKPPMWEELGPLGGNWV